MATLAAVILTKNEADTVGACIDSLHGWVDAVVVWDVGSDDKTQEVARSAGAQVVEHPFENFAAQRNAALDGVDAEWIFFVDADERATEAVAKEIRAIVDGNVDVVGYWIPRRNFIVGREIRGGGFYPDHQLRLLRKGAARYDPKREVHEVVELDGAEAYLQEPLIHINYTSWPQFYAKQRFYSAYEARILDGRGIRPRPHNFVLQPLREFYRRIVSLEGWRDGFNGLRLALLLAWYYGFKPYWILMMENR